MTTEAGKTGTSRGMSTYNSLDIKQLRELIAKEQMAALSVLPKETICEQRKKTKKIYFAGPWFNEKSNSFYNSATVIAAVSTPYSEYKVFFPRCQINDKPSDAFTKNVENIQDCDMVVAFVDEKDVGTAWEIGMAYSLKKKIVLLGLDDTTFLSHTNVMLAFTGTCTTLKEFSKLLMGQDYETIKIEDKWEGIE